MTTDITNVSVYIIEKNEIPQIDILGVCVAHLNKKNAPYFNLEGKIPKVAQDVRSLVIDIKRKHPDTVAMMVVDDTAEIVLHEDVINGPTNIENSLRWIHEYGKMSINITKEASCHTYDMIFRYFSRPLMIGNIQFLIRSLLFDKKYRRYLEDDIAQFNNNLKVIITVSERRNKKYLKIVVCNENVFWHQDGLIKRPSEIFTLKHITAKHGLSKICL